MLYGLKFTYILLFFHKKKTKKQFESSHLILGGLIWNFPLTTERKPGGDPFSDNQTLNTLSQTHSAVQC